jgi:hypothetical protein
VGSALNGARVVLAVFGTVIGSYFPDFPFDISFQILDELLSLVETTRRVRTQKIQSRNVCVLANQHQKVFHTKTKMSPRQGSRWFDLAIGKHQSWQTLRAHPP